MRSLIPVTQEHKDKGIRGSPYSCPITLALRDALGGFWIVTGRSAWRRITDPAPVRLSRSAQRFAKRFDEGKDVQPFRFWFES